MSKAGVLTSGERGEFLDRINVAHEHLDKGSKHLKAFIETIEPIKTKKLYRDTYNTFADFVEAEFEVSASRIYKQIQEIRVLENLKNVDTVSTKLPTRQQARVLSQVSEDEQADAWAEAQEMAVERGEEKPDLEDVKEVVADKPKRVQKTVKPKKDAPEVHPDVKKMQKLGDAITSGLDRLINQVGQWAGYYDSTDDVESMLEDLESCANFFKALRQGVEA